MSGDAGHQNATRQADRPQRLAAAQLRQAGENMLDAGARRGDAPIVPLLRL